MYRISTIGSIGDGPLPGPPNPLDPCALCPRTTTVAPDGTVHVVEAPVSATAILVAFFLGAGIALAADRLLVK